jgi:hypothetical protein
MLRTVKTGQSDIDVLHGKPAAARGWLDLQFGLHDAAKANAVTAEWTRSVIKIIDSEARAGRDVTSPAALLRIEGMAYREAQAAKFRQENWAVTAYNRAVGSMRASDNPIANATGIAAKLLLPVVRVPTNLAFEVAQHAFGLGTGSILATRAWMKGVENLKPHEAEAVMRNLKKGSIGAAALLVGYLNPTVFGGYYSGKRDDKDVQAGGMRLFGKEVPSWLLHNPLMEALQMGATVRRASEKLYHQTPQGDAVGIGQGLAGWVEEIPFAREPVELAKAISPDPQERGRFFGSMARSFAVPQLVQWLAGQMDKNPRTGQPVKRKPQGVIQNVQMGLPGLRQQVPAAP